MIGRRSVRQLLGVLLAVFAVVLLSSGLIGIMSVRSATTAVDNFSERLAPAERANATYMRDVYEAQSAIRAFSLSGQRSNLTEYHQAIANIPGDQAALLSYAREDTGLASLTAHQRVAWHAWISGYADVRLAMGGGPGTFSGSLHDRGQRLFNRVRRDNATIQTQLDMAAGRARQSAQDHLHATITLIAAVTLGGALFCCLVGLWVVNQVRGPLSRLEHVVNRLGAGDHQARAPRSGPREIRRVGSALNELAEENQRAREVEGAINSQLRAMDTVKTDFVSNVSHELRTPLTIIAGYVEMLSDDLGNSLTPEQRGMLQVTERNVTRLRQLIEDLLALNMAEASNTSLEHVDLAQIMNDVCNDVRFAATSKLVVLRLRRTTAPLRVLADPSQLHRALLNLIINAVKFSDSGGMVRISMFADGSDAVIEIVDEGMGIPEAELPMLGARFYRASNARAGEIAGTGLGLRIVQTILTNHHGLLELASVEGSGTTARVRLPLIATPESEVAGRADRLAGIGEQTFSIEASAGRPDGNISGSSLVDSFTAPDD